MFDTSLSPSELTETLVRCLKVNLVPMVRGQPAIGKSDIIRSVAKQLNLKLVDFRLGQSDPTDLNGLPRFREDGRAEFVPFDDFPLDGDELPTWVDEDGKTHKYAGWLLFFDELTSANKDLQAAAYKPILDRQMGKRDLHKRVRIIAAGNNMQDNAVVYEMSTAFQSRLIHLDLGVNKGDWVNWALGAGIDSRIIGFIEFKPDMLYTFDPNHSDHTYASPRTWEFVSKLIIYTDVSNADLPLLAGTLGPGVAQEFITYVQVYSQLPTIEDIVAKPETATVPSEISMKYAMATFLADHMNQTNVKELVTYLLRLPVETRVVCLRMTNKRSPDLMQHKALQPLYQDLMRLM